MNEWTPEPWEVLGPGSEWGTARIFAGSRYIGSIGNSDETEAQTMANARRIVDCVNACAGMADPAAEIARLREALRVASIDVAYESAENISLREACARYCQNAESSRLRAEEAERRLAEALDALQDVESQFHAQELADKLADRPCPRYKAASVYLDITKTRAALAGKGV